MTKPTCKSRFTFGLPDYWTPEQALAIVEFIGDLARQSGLTTRSSWSRRIASWTHAMIGGPSSGAPPAITAF